MTRTIAAFAVAVVLLASPAFAHDVDGKWSGTVTTPMGDLPVTFDFKADGANISYNITFDLGGMAFDISYKGVVSPAEIKITADVMGMPLEFVVKKAQ